MLDSPQPSYAHHHVFILQTLGHVLSEPLTWQAREGLLCLLCQCLVSSTLKVKPGGLYLFLMVLQGCRNTFTELLQAFLDGRYKSNVSSQEHKYVLGQGLGLCSWFSGTRVLCPVASPSIQHTAGLSSALHFFTLYFLTFGC